MNEDLETREIESLDQLEVQKVNVRSNRTSFISIGSFDYISKIDFKCGFNFNSTFKLIKNSAYEFNDETEIEFLNIHFKSSFTFNESRIIVNPIKFVLCKFYDNLVISDKTFQSRLLFNKCQLLSFYSQNVEFIGSFELYKCKILERCVFFTTDFKNNVDLVDCDFMSNTFFTYSKFQEQVLFNGSKFKDKNNKPCGLDLSLSIIRGSLSFFQTYLENYKTQKIEGNTQEYNDAIREGTFIPSQNKRETFRIIKNQLIEQNNLIEAEKYAKLEKQSYLRELFNDFKLKNLSDLTSLFLNRMSNNYRTDFIQALLFTLVVAFISHFILQFSGAYNFTFENYVRLLNPTDFSFYNSEEKTSGLLYLAYFLSKIVIGYGIYQFIQAFRKFR